MTTLNVDNVPLLLQRVAVNDQEAFASLFFHYQEKISQVTLLYTKDVVVVEEILQEVFLKVWQKRTSLTALEDFESWLFVVTRNHVLDYLKKWANRKLVETSWQARDGKEEQEADYKLRHAAYQQLLQQAVASLSPQQQAVFLLAREQQLTYDAIGQKLSISPFTVKKHMQRALQQIRAYLAAHGDITVLLFFLLKK